MDETIKFKIIDILSKQNDMTLATIREDGYPQATTVAYARDVLDIYFGCTPHSQKARNIAQSNKISLTITPHYTDWNSIRGLSIGGRAELLIERPDIMRTEAMFFAKFPFLVQYAPDARSNLTLYRIVPEVISVLDYTKQFGHVDYVTLPARK